MKHLVAVALVAALAGCATAPAPVEPPQPVVAAAPEPEPPAPPASAPPPPAAAASDVAAPPIDPLRPEVPVDLDASSARLDLWQRVRDGFALPDLDTPLVRKHEQWYAARPDYVQRMTERGSLYLFHIVEEVQKRGMPTELALLPFIESAFNPQALSVAKASGMWQFMPGTGRTFELAQNVFRDDRRDVLASTRAALDYLDKLYVMFGDWQLALAAYNWGEGNVQRAIERNRKKRLGTDYASLRMPDETRNYVPKLQAVKNIVLRPGDFGLALPPLDNHPYFLTVAIERDIDVALAARLAAIDLDSFRQLNPQLDKPVILAAGTPRVLLPYANANLFVRNLAGFEGATATWTAWVAPRTMRPAEAAKHVGMSEDELRDVNRIPQRVSIKAGSTLVVPRNGHDDVSEHIAENATIVLAPDRPSRRIVFKAGRRGDSVHAVARRYRVDAAQLAQWNHVAQNGRFAAGARIVVYVPQKAVAKSGKTVRTASAKTKVKSKTRKVAGRPVKMSAAAAASAR